LPKPAEAGPAKVADPAGESGAQATSPEAAASPDDGAADAKKKLSRVVQPDPHAKPAKPKIRAEPKRTDARRSRAEAKEQSWNADSPFMPVTTPKR
jgi:hypothetical protein